ncbi:MAG: protease modulator HflK, partial [Sedimentisphaerales bacterium]|nr:protease modulator HflK [Sedimentisphaerales bacterium]
MTVSSKRPVHVALVSLVLSIIFFGISFFLGRWSGFTAVSAVGWLILSVAFIWFVLCLQFYQRSLAEQEKLDASQLIRGDETSTIFQAGSERATLLSASQRRLEIFERWFIPILAAIIAAFQIGIGLYLLKASGAGIEPETKQPLLCGIILTAIAFVSFLLSRYATGMSAQPEWKPLRAGGSSLLGIAVLCFILAVCLAVTYIFPNIYWPVNVMTWVISCLLVVLGAETAVNLVLDIYRPRIRGRYSRSAFDSRLLGVINEPGGILRSAADAIDYQFGFKVSQTWFYKLLEEAIVPLMLFGVVTLYLFSCVVVVEPDEQAIVEHFGNPVNEAGETRILGPGLALKWPWPINIVYKYPTERISEISIGFVPKIDPKTGEQERKPLLWGEKHYQEEYRLMVASEQIGTESMAATVPVSLVIAAVPVQYRIKDLYSFIYNHNEPEKLLESICYRELTKFAASAKIETGNQNNGGDSLLGTGRAKAGRTLTERIQNAVDEQGLGVEIVFVGLQGIHPPPEVAADYQKVIGAVQKKQALILNAQAERNNTLGPIVGSVGKTEKLYELWLKYQQAEGANSQEEIEKIAGELDLSFEEAKGDIFKTLRQAQSYAFQKEVLAGATGDRFAEQLKAYRAAPEIYLQEQRLSMLEETLDGIRKYVVVADQNDT